MGADLSYVLAHPDNFWRVETAVPAVPDDPCYKANVRVVGSFDRCREVASLLADRLPGLDFVCPMPGTPHIDITPHGFGKDHGGDFLMERLGLTPDEVCCFGDAENDLAVLRHYSHSVAVANAVPAVRACARHHIGPADEEFRGARAARHRRGHGRGAHAVVHGRPLMGRACHERGQS